jgi:hypothetical protein
VVPLRGEAEVASEGVVDRILQVMAADSISTVYQAMFQLPHQTVVGYEARFPRPAGRSGESVCPERPVATPGRPLAGDQRLTADALLPAAPKPARVV